MSPGALKTQAKVLRLSFSIHHITNHKVGMIKVFCFVLLFLGCLLPENKSFPSKHVVLVPTDKHETKLKGVIYFQAIEEVYYDHLRSATKVRRLVFISTLSSLCVFIKNPPSVPSLSQ